MAARAARPATAIELPTVLAAPLKGTMGEPVAGGGMTLGYVRCGGQNMGRVRYDLRSG